MKRYTARNVAIARLAALVLLTLCLVQPPVGAHALETAADPMPSPIDDHRDGPLILPTPPIGFVFGQTLRITVAHVSKDSIQGQSPPDVRVEVWLLDAQGRVIAQSAGAHIPRNGFRSFDFDRAALALEGEPGTGRLQVRAHLRASIDAPSPAATQARTGLIASLEVIDDSTGKTVTLSDQQCLVFFLGGTPDN